MYHKRKYTLPLKDRISIGRNFSRADGFFFLDIILFLDNVFLLKEAAENKKCLFFKHTVKSLSPK